MARTEPEQGRRAPGGKAAVRDPAEGEGLRGQRRVQYIVGYFFRDERDPESRKLWWRDGDSAVAMQNPARWRDHYTDMEWTDMDEEVRA